MWCRFRAFLFGSDPSSVQQHLFPSTLFIEKIMTEIEKQEKALEQQSISSIIIDLLAWEQPFMSSAFLVAINCIFWLIVSWNRRFFSIFSIFALLLFGYRTWVCQVWPEIRVPPEEGEDTESWTTMNPGVLSVPEVSRYLNDFSEKMIVLWKDVWKLRKENHGLFCALMCGFFSILGIIGELIPGVLIIYSLVLIVSLGPGIALHLLPSNLYDQMLGFFAETDSQVSDKCGSKSDKDSDLEEFMPEELTDDILRNLSLREDVPEVPSPGIVLTGSGNLDSLLDHDNSIMEVDELALYEGLGTFPSLDDEAESDSEGVISENSLLPRLEPVKEEMNFVTTHFKEDSSGSENDVVFTEGMSFSKSEDLSVGTDSGSLMSTDDKKQNTSKQEKSSASDLENDDDLADFEILDESEIKSS